MPTSSFDMGKAVRNPTNPWWMSVDVLAEDISQDPNACMGSIACISLNLRDIFEDFRKKPYAKQCDRNRHGPIVYKVVIRVNGSGEREIITKPESFFTSLGCLQLY